MTMPEYEAPADNLEASSSQTSVIESILSESESLTLSDVDYEFSVGNSVSSSSESEYPAQDSGSSGSGYDKIRIPLEQDLRQLLVKVTETEDLESVTSIRLRVIARDFSLQRLPVYMPQLTELNLDGSCLVSLRDLGCNLNSLVILHVTRTGLHSLDGLFGLQSLVQLYAGSNHIKEMSACATIPFLEVLDLRKNAIAELNSVSFLMLCTALKHLTLEGNLVTDMPNYRSVVYDLLPGLTSLDGIDLPVEVRSIEKELAQTRLPKIISRFPPIPSSARRLHKDDHDRNFLKSRVRPVTTGSIGFSTNKDKLKMLPVRPATARNALRNDFANMTNGAALKLNDIRNMFIPSKLTSGTPICGNPAVALLEKRRMMAWEDPEIQN